MRAARPRCPIEDAAARTRVAAVGQHSTADDAARDVCNRRARPMCEIAGTLATLASLASAARLGGIIGAWRAGDVLKSTARSHVLNGAVNGTSARATRTPAASRDNMDDA